MHVQWVSQLAWVWGGQGRGIHLSQHSHFEPHEVTTSGCASNWRPCPKQVDETFLGLLR